MSILEPSLAFTLRTETRPSGIAGAGDGVFALENAERGRFVGMDFPRPELACGEDEILELPVEIRKFSWRQIEHRCFAANPDERVPTDLMNHSFEPNVHWHLGHYFIVRDVHAGDELFLDYRYMLSPRWNGRLADGETGRPVDGLAWRESVVRSCRLLIEILAGTED